MYQEVFSGLGRDLRMNLLLYFRKVIRREVVLVKRYSISFSNVTSSLTFYGVAHVLLPSNSRVTGLSKLARAVSG